jgi:CheY-like chemotaxis protein
MCARGIHRMSSRRVLYVDDERPLVSLTVRGLKPFGYQVVGFSDPVEALNTFKAEPGAFDAAITDLTMPQLSGLSLASQLKAVRQELPVIAMSGYVTPQDRERCDACGINEVLAKPFTLDCLARALDRLLA